MRKKIGLFIYLIFVGVYLIGQTNIEISTEKVIIDGKKYYLHNVEEGQTLYSICRAYKISEEEILLNNPEIKNKSIKMGQALKIPVIEEVTTDGKYIVYLVKPGDTLYSLCRKYEITEDEFYLLNSDLKQNKALKIGQEIKFPIKVIEDKISDPDKDTVNFYYHLVEKGETVYGLSRTYNVTKEELMEHNPEFDGMKLMVGEVLKIPKKSGAINEDLNRIVLDSIAKINFVNEDTVKLSDDFCNQENWFKNGKNFNIVIFLPFEISSNIRALYNQATSNREQRLYLITEKMISFYSGCLMALEKFKNLDVKLNVSVYDTGNENIVISSLIEKGVLDSVDVIIGPAFRSQVDFLNSNLKNEKTVIILPFIDDSEILEKYSRNIMLKPAKNYVIDGIADYAALNKQHNYLIIQGNSSEQIKISTLYKEALTEAIGSGEHVKIIQFTGKNLTSLKTLVDKDRENVFILPFHSETICTNVFLDLFPLKDYEITLIADEAVLEYQTIDPSYFAKVKFSYYSGIKVNYSDTETKNLIAEYRNVFLCEPDDNSFAAYDAISYFIMNLVRYGNNMPYCLQKDSVYQGVSGLQKYTNHNSFAKYSYANQSVYIYTMQEDYSFKQVYPVIVEEDAENN
ncbi:MAG TPA: LysM peptidoglycan-binding domain-containing protein [Bacteroidales bacterium]|nr:LysM peptidoglycan-binding domain-containing protein [Bacteroidales bacterium]